MWVSGDLFYKDRLCPEVTSVQHCTPGALNQKPGNCQRVDTKVGQKSYITEPGQWLASIRVIVTHSSLDISIFVGSFKGKARWKTVNDNEEKG